MDIVVVKDEQNKLRGFGEKGQRAWLRFRNAIEALEIGETLSFAWHKPRSPKFHRYHFAMLHAVYEQQEQFQDFDAFRMWCQVGAGHCELVPGPRGKPVAIPKSIAYESLDDNEFAEHHMAVCAFLRSTHACRFLWPEMSDVDADASINAILQEFER